MLRRLPMAVVITAILSLTACSRSDVSFKVVDGLCYRTKNQYSMGIHTDQSTVLALPQNCGLTPGVIAPNTPTVTAP